ncbi:MAG: two pore domain potassium channel family protein [Acidobacteria bacterium]|nr:MAG: two pore domain potassium channel family protein [Acidobacteriota bacterium]
MERRRLPEILSADAGLTVLLVSLFVVLFVIYPFVPLSGTGRLLVTLGLTVVLISGSFSLGDRPRLRRIVIGLAAVALALHWLRHLVLHDAVLIGAHAATSLFLLLTLGGVLDRVIREGRVTSHHIQGAVAVYLMLGLVWGFTYSVIELRHPGSFTLPDATRSTDGPEDTGDKNTRELIYFSFVTLTTLGYGDVSPVNSGARALAILEALVGQLYLVILIARLVSRRVAGSDGDSSP